MTAFAVRLSLVICNRLVPFAIVISLVRAPVHSGACAEFLARCGTRLGRGYPRRGPPRPDLIGTRRRR
ncbi:hypothetical protein GCM10022205_19450 [Spinactinospora alkalitolerans]